MVSRSVEITVTQRVVMPNLIVACPFCNLAEAILAKAMSTVHVKAISVPHSSGFPSSCLGKWTVLQSTPQPLPNLF